VTTYQLSPRVTLTPGDTIRVAGGPYYRLADGSRVPLAARGLHRVVEVIHQRSRVYLLAYGPGGYSMLHVAGRRRSRVAGLVCRPYRVRRIGGGQKKIRAARKTD
jgi:hypothetical protein